MNNTPSPTTAPTVAVPEQFELPGLPRGSSLIEILAAYGLKPTEVPGGLRRYRHELQCSHLKAIFEVEMDADGEVDAFRIWSQRPRKRRGSTTPDAS